MRLYFNLFNLLFYAANALFKLLRRLLINFDSVELKSLCGEVWFFRLQSNKNGLSETKEVIKNLMFSVTYAQNVHNNMHAHTRAERMQRSWIFSDDSEGEPIVLNNNFQVNM